jgi:hydroxylamine reductase
MKITKKTTLAKILQENPKAAKLLIESGMHCIGCPMAMQETLEQGCLAHGMEDKDIEEIVEKLNKKEKKK